MTNEDKEKRASFIESLQHCIYYLKLDRKEYPRSKDYETAFTKLLGAMNMLDAEGADEACKELKQVLYDGRGFVLADHVTGDGYKPTVLFGSDDVRHNWMVVHHVCDYVASRKWMVVD